MAVSAKLDRRAADLFSVAKTTMTTTVAVVQMTAFDKLRFLAR